MKTASRIQPLTAVRLVPVAVRGVVFGGVLVAVLALVGSPTLADRWTLWAVQATLACSLVITWGIAGIFSLGQTAMYGLGAYAAGIVAINLGRDSGWSLVLAIIAGVAAGALFAWVTGLFVFAGRVTPIEVAIITLGVTLVLYVIFNNTADPRFAIGDAKLGGFNGMVGVPKPRIADFLLTEKGLFALTASLGVVTASLLAAWHASRWGRVAEAIRMDERRAQLLGYNVQRRQRQTFVIGGAVAGLAGAMYTAWSRFDDPNLFSLKPAVLLIIWVLVGSKDSLVGAFVGVVLVEGLTTWLGGSQGEYSPIYLGVALIAIVLLLPNGLVATVSEWRRSRAPDTSPTDGGGISTGRLDRLATLVSSSPSGITATGLTKQFGGLRAVADLDLTFPATGMTCIIGPNGAGKSTALGLLSGLIRPTAGTISYDGRDIKRQGPHARARRGIALKTQVAAIFPELSVADNLALALDGPGRRPERLDPTGAAEILGLRRVLDQPAGALSHGEQQWLDISMAICTRPGVLLLDEPTAGLSVGETTRIADLLREVSAHIHVVVIDHDMDFIRMLAAPTIVMHLGRLLVADDFDAIVNNEAVHDVYLGRSQHAAD